MSHFTRHNTVAGALQLLQARPETLYL